MPVDTSCPEAAYLTKDNIVHPGSVAQVAAAEVRARSEMTQKLGVAVTGGSIRKGSG